MTDNVIKLTEEPKRIWVCDCGCSTFTLVDGGNVECAMCESDGHGKTSGWFTPRHGSETSNDKPVKDIAGNGSIDFARRRLAQIAQDDGNALLIAAHEGGSVSSWSRAETQEQLDWVRDKVETALSLIKENVIRKAE